MTARFWISKTMSARWPHRSRAGNRGWAPALPRSWSFPKGCTRISDKFFFWKSVGSMRDTFDIGGSFQLSVLKDVLSMRLGQSVSGTIREFIKDPRVAQMLDHYVQYVGSSPDNSPAILCSIGHMQAEQGIWYPQGRNPRRSRGAGPSGQRAGRALSHLDRDCTPAH